MTAVENILNRCTDTGHIYNQARDCGYVLNDVSFETLKRLKLKDIQKIHIGAISNDGDVLVFTDIYDVHYIQFHDQECCEVVEIKEITGNKQGILNSEILFAEEIITHTPKTSDLPNCINSSYKLTTHTDQLNITWSGGWDCDFLDDQELQNGRCSLYKLVPIEKST